MLTCWREVKLETDNINETLTTWFSAMMSTRLGVTAARRQRQLICYIQSAASTYSRPIARLEIWLWLAWVIKLFTTQLWGPTLMAGNKFNHQGSIVLWRQTASWLPGSYRQMADLTFGCAINNGKARRLWMQVCCAAICFYLRLSLRLYVHFSLTRLSKYHGFFHTQTTFKFQSQRWWSQHLGQRISRQISGPLSSTIGG